MYKYPIINNVSKFHLIPHLFKINVEWGVTQEIESTTLTTPKNQIHDNRMQT